MENHDPVHCNLGSRCCKGWPRYNTSKNKHVIIPVGPVRKPNGELLPITMVKQGVYLESNLGTMGMNPHYEEVSPVPVAICNGSDTLNNPLCSRRSDGSPTAASYAQLERIIMGL